VSKVINDGLVDKIMIIPATSEHPSRTIEKALCTEELAVVSSSLEFFSWSELLYLATAVLDRQGIATDGTGFRYPTDEVDPGETPLEGVEVYNPLGEVQVSVHAFERLMTKYFRAVIAGAEANRNPALQEEWWPRFVDAVQAVSQRSRNDLVQQHRE
jgi:hypothetical protein